MLPTLYCLPRDGPGQLATMACPRGGDWLTDEFNGLRRAGIDVIVCTLTEIELVERHLTQAPDVATAAGIRWVHFPITDRSVPPTSEASELVGDLTDLLTLGSSIVVHCRAGIGRSSLIAASVLVREGTPPDDAWRRIATARGLPVPDTDQQRAWLSTMAGA